MELLVLGYLILSLTDSAFQVGLIAVLKKKKNGSKK